MLNVDPGLQSIAERHGRMVEVCIITGDREKALAAVHSAFEARGVSEAITAKTTTAAILTPRIASILESGGIRTIGDVCAHTRESLAAIHQIRYRSVDLIEQALDRHGFRLRRN